MKNIQKMFLTLLAVLLFQFAVQAQVPQAINYQGVARDGMGSPIGNRNISLRFSIRSGSASGPVQYSETRNLSTNGNGLYVAKIGTGSPISGSFSQISWNKENVSPILDPKILMRV